MPALKSRLSLGSSLASLASRAHADAPGVLALLRARRERPRGRRAPDEVPSPYEAASATITGPLKHVCVGHDPQKSSRPSRLPRTHEARMTSTGRAERVPFPTPEIRH